ncbi:MAG: hypothetical protein C4519_24335 [Desulfobacteraceae bacterium]|nr:MAG: hypothetical protein C4519_24335 [Desulfobacteraceae bacterium]
MSIQTEAKRVKYGQSLTDLDNQANSAITQLEGIKTNLLNMISAMQADEDFTAEDEAEAQAVIQGLAARIQALLS